MDRERLFILHQCEGIGWKRIYQMLKADPTLAQIFKMKSRELSNFFQLSEAAAEKLSRHLASSSFKKLFDTYNNANITFIAAGDPDYPVMLKSIFDPPWVIYAKGDVEYFSRTCISVVGTRKPTPYGIKSTSHLLLPLIRQGWTTVSGLASGIDTAVHRLSLSEKQPTIAVLGHGLGMVYPDSNKFLADQIVKKGILLSEFAYHNRPKKWQFPMRNRIISGLSPGTLIIEAQQKSGSLITADQALEQGREVFAVPGSILEPSCSGTNTLIQNGAKLVADFTDIVAEYPKAFSEAFS
ncbi:DNA-processing protein DprA [Fictibacillus aquaticus]|uniref:DNA-protecting protein DprA n=1 Tax=Fictibacillus aquaticus TaxID=2021314 RepID=A0A235FD43_9BACL|nr:DNA-processing protein DprA [Fictibacillus aquaticus]OYD58867.1 DNA-protecting protein DprA [Fictibacillus aquaticus]